MRRLTGVESRRLSSAAVLHELGERLAGGAVGDAAPELQGRLVTFVREAVDVLAELQRGSRACAVCGEVLARKSYESPSTFAARVTCDQRCAGVLRGWRKAAAKAAAAAATPPKVCEQCGKTFERRVTGAYETPKAFAVRRFCCHRCATLWNNARRAGQPTGPRRELRESAPTAVRREPLPLPDPRLASGALAIGAPSLIEFGTVAVGRLAFDVSVCEAHGEQRGFFGCPACNASAKRRAAERARPWTPLMGGRRAQAE